MIDDFLINKNLLHVLIIIFYFLEKVPRSARTDEKEQKWSHEMMLIVKLRMHDEGGCRGDLRLTRRIQLLLGTAGMGWDFYSCSQPVKELLFFET